MDKATEAALRESWTLYREHIGGSLTVSWDSLPEHRKEAWRIVTAPFRRMPERTTGAEAAKVSAAAARRDQAAAVAGKV